ncbi:adenosyl-hopene transferase HpnH [Cupriavidus basilensis]
MSRQKRYPLALMLEPLFRRNLACNGCGKIDYPDPIPNQRLSVDECLGAVDECGAPVVSIAGGEPLLHKDMPELCAASSRGASSSTCATNALLMEKKLDQYAPSPYFVWSVHLDGDREMHDHSVSQEGVRGRRRSHPCGQGGCAAFASTSIARCLGDAASERVAAFFDTVKEMGVDGITVSPGYAYERAPDQQHFLNRGKTKQLFRDP